MYHSSINDLPLNNKINVNSLFEFEQGEKPTALTSLLPANKNNYFIFITKNGMIKKTKSEEYNIRRGKSIKAISLKDDDEVINVLFTNNEKVGILTNNGNYVIIETDDISAIGRTSQGIKAIKLVPNDYVIDAKIIHNNDKYIITLSKEGLVKKANLNEFPTCSRATKGKRISDIKENDSILKFLTIDADCDIIIITKQKSIKISTSELRELSRSAVGVKAINIDSTDQAKDLKRNQTS